MAPNVRLISQQSNRRFTYDDIVNLAQTCYPKVDNLRVLHSKLEKFSKETLGFAGVYDLLTVEVDVNGKSETLTFFVKALSPFANDFQKMIFNEEFKFFSDVMPRIMESYDGKSWAARCLMARDNVLILEDLRIQGYRVTRKLSDQQLRSAIRSIARFHASSLLLEDKLQRPLDQVFAGYFVEKLFSKDDVDNWKFMLAGVEVVEAVAKNLNLDSKNTLEAYEWLTREIKPKAEETNVLCHCDLWCNNVMFDDSGDNNCRLVDFQQAVYTSHVIDLVQFIHLNVNRETKRRLEVNLLQLYHTQLHETLGRNNYKGKTIQLEELMRNFEKKRIIGLVTATQTLPLALLSGESSKEFTKDDKHFKRYMFESRRDFVLNVVRQDVHYRRRIEEVVEDLVNYMDKFFSVDR